MRRSRKRHQRQQRHNTTALRRGGVPCEFSRGGADAALIALSQPYEVAYWSKKFRITPAKLKAAVTAAGHSSGNVGAYLAKQKAAKKTARKTAKNTTKKAVKKKTARKTVKKATKKKAA